MPRTGEVAEGQASVTTLRARLREAVLSGEMLQGVLYSQDAMIEMLGVRRTPFREALRMVQAEGLIQMLPNGRLRAPALSMDDFGEIQTTRMAIDSAAARIAIARYDADDLARLEGLMAQMAHYIAHADFDRLEAPHREFHLALVAPAGTDFVAILDELIDRTLRYRWAFAPELPQFWDDRAAEHREILEAAKLRDAERMVAALTRHHLTVAQRLAERMEVLGDAAARADLDRHLRDALAPSRRSTQA